MTFPDLTQESVLSTVCSPVPVGNFDLCVVFPGGAEVCAQVESFPPSLLQLARGLLSQASSALAPLQPIFNIIDVLVAVQNCLEAIPKALGPPPDPRKLTACVGDLASTLAELLKLVPQLSIPLLIVGLLDTLITLLQGVLAELRAVARLVDRITRAQAIQSQSLLQLVVCAEESKQNQLDNLSSLFASINPLIELINAFAGLAGLEAIPSFTGGLGEDPTAAIEPLEDLVRFLTDVRDSIPV